MMGARPHLVVRNGILYFQGSPEPEPSYRIVVPVVDRLDLIRELHEPHHSGARGTCSRLAQRFWWPGLRYQVEDHVQSCENCDRDRIANPSPKAPMGGLPAGHPFAVVHMDLVGGQSTLTREPEGNRAILTLIDGFTGWAEAVPLPNQKAETVARAFFDNWICRYGVPERIHTDQGTQFESAVFSKMLDLLKIHRSRTTPYRPQANGKVERFNRTMISWLRKAVDDDPVKWELMLPAIMMAYRSTISRPTGFTPYRLVFGREMRLGVDYGTPFPDKILEIDDFASNLIRKLETAFELARDNRELCHLRARDLYDTGVVAHHYLPGSWVRQEITRVAPARGMATKFQPRFSARFQVLGTSGPSVLLLDP